MHYKIETNNLTIMTTIYYKRANARKAAEAYSKETRQPIFIGAIDHRCDWDADDEFNEKVGCWSGDTAAYYVGEARFAWWCEDEN